jgi:hypothetical protein
LQFSELSHLNKTSQQIGRNQIMLSTSKPMDAAVAVSNSSAAQTTPPIKMDFFDGAEMPRLVVFAENLPKVAIKQFMDTAVHNSSP